MRQIVEANRAAGRTDEQIQDDLAGLMDEQDQEGRDLLAQVLAE